MSVDVQKILNRKLTAIGLRSAILRTPAANRDKKMTTVTGHAVTANRLVDGAVVYLTGDGGWSGRLDDCLAADDEAGLARIKTFAVEAERAHIVVSAYVFEIVVEDGAVRAVRRREAIRAAGPTAGPAAIGARDQYGGGCRVSVR